MYSSLMKIEEIKVWMIEEMKRKGFSGLFQWRKSVSIKGGFELVYHPQYKREDYPNVSETIWQRNYHEKNRNFTCCVISPQLLKDLASYKGISVKDELIRFTIYDLYLEGIDIEDLIDNDHNMM